MLQQPGDSHQWKTVTFDPDLSPKVVFVILDNKPQRDRKEEEGEGYKGGSEDFTGMLEEPWC